MSTDAGQSLKTPNKLWHLKEVSTSLLAWVLVTLIGSFIISAMKWWVMFEIAIHMFDRIVLLVWGIFILVFIVIEYQEAYAKEVVRLNEPKQVMD